jgi:hypothetical protein
VLVELIGAWSDDTIGLNENLLAFLRIEFVTWLEQKLITSPLNNHDMCSGAVPMGGYIGAFANLQYV